MSEVEKCRICNKNYQVSELGGQMPGSKDPEDITCPYCHNTITRRSNGYFQTHALPEDQQ